MIPLLEEIFNGFGDLLKAAEITVVQSPATNIFAGMATMPGIVTYLPSIVSPSGLACDPIARCRTTSSPLHGDDRQANRAQSGYYGDTLSFTSISGAGLRTGPGISRPLMRERDNPGRWQRRCNGGANPLHGDGRQRRGKTTDN